MPKNPFSRAIQKLRKEQGLSQSEAAKKWGVNLRTLQAWEIGLRLPPPFFAKCILFYLRSPDSAKVKK